MHVELQIVRLERAGLRDEGRIDLLAEAERHRGGEAGRHDGAALAHDVHGHQPGLLLEDQPVAGHRPAVAGAGAGQHEGGADIGMAGEGHLGLGREDADLGGVGRVLGRQHEGRLGQVELGCDGLHPLARQALCIGDDGQRVAPELAVGEDVHGDEVEFHDSKSAMAR